MLGVEPIPETTTENGSTGTGKSVEDRIRARHKARRGNSRVDLQVPGHEPEPGAPSDLGVRYRPLDPDDLERLEKVAKDKNIQTRIDLATDALIAVCDCILIRGEDGKFKPLLIDGEPVSYEDKLATWFGQEFDTAREIVLSVFSELPAAYVGVLQHADDIERWMNGDPNVGEESLLGES